MSYFQIMSGGVKCLKRFMLFSIESTKKRKCDYGGYLVNILRKLSSHGPHSAIKYTKTSKPQRFAPLTQTRAPSQGFSLCFRLMVAILSVNET